MARGSDVRVDKVEICYYDGGQSYLQPVYRYEATIKLRASVQKVRLANSHVLGYVPIGTAREPLVQRLKPEWNPPTSAKGSVVQKSPPRGDPTVGRYIVQNAGDDGF